MVKLDAGDDVADQLEDSLRWKTVLKQKATRKSYQDAAVYSEGRWGAVSSSGKNFMIAKREAVLTEANRLIQKKVYAEDPNYFKLDTCSVLNFKEFIDYRIENLISEPFKNIEAEAQKILQSNEEILDLFNAHKDFGVLFALKKVRSSPESSGLVSQLKLLEGNCVNAHQKARLRKDFGVADWNKAKNILYGVIDTYDWHSSV